LTGTDALTVWRRAISLSSRALALVVAGELAISQQQPIADSERALHARLGKRKHDLRVAMVGAAINESQVLGIEHVPAARAAIRGVEFDMKASELRRGGVPT
jgi:hypothetical protein